jgi:hypothetical protein
MSRNISFYRLYDVIFQNTMFFLVTAEELHVLHCTAPWMLMLLSSHFGGFDLNSVGYCLLGCDVMRSGGNLQMCWRNAHKFQAHLQNTFWVTTGWDEIIKLCLILLVSKYKNDGTTHTLLFAFCCLFFLPILFFFCCCFTKQILLQKIRQKGMLFYIYFLWVNYIYLSRSLDEDSGETEHTPTHKIVT